MAGHSKFANIKRRKSAQDSKRSALFSKLIRDITCAAKEGGGNVDDNAALRSAVEKALNANMKRAKIEKAIARATGKSTALGQEEYLYEAYASGGVALLIECITDNRKRTVATVRHALSRFGATLAASGSVKHLFEYRGEIVLDVTSISDSLMERLMLTDADSIEESQRGVQVLCAAEFAMSVCETLQSSGFEIVEVRRRYIPKLPISVDKGEEDSGLEDKLIAALRELDDVVEVYTNIES